MSGRPGLAETWHPRVIKSHTTPPLHPEGLPLLESLIGSPFCAVRTYEKNVTVCRQGDRLSSMYLVSKGEVLLTRLSADGRETVLAILREGEFFGEMVLLGSFMATFNAYPTRRTTLLVLPHHKFNDLASTPGSCRVILQAMARRCEDAWAQIEAMGCIQAEDKIRSALHWLATRIGIKTNDGIEIRLSQAQLAQIIGCTRETLNRRLRALKVLDALAVKGTKRRQVLVILKPEALA